MNQKRLFLSVLFIFLISITFCASATDVYNVDSQMDVEKIQKKIDTAQEGDTILFAEGEYNINGLSVNKAVTLEGSEGTVLIGTGESSIQKAPANIGFTLNSDDICIKNFTFKDYAIAIYFPQATINTIPLEAITIEYNTFENNNAAIYLCISNSTIQYNTVINCKEGVLNGLKEFGGYAITGYGTNGKAENILYYKNNVNDSKYGIANYIANSRIESNTINSSKFSEQGSSDGIANTYNGMGSIIIGNTVSEVKTRDDDKIVAGIRNDCDDVIIKNNIVHDSQNGIRDNSVNHGINRIASNVRIEKNNVYNNANAGILEECNESNIINNQVKDNNYGIFYIGMNGNISKNNIIGNDSSNMGISIFSPLLNVYDNTITDYSQNKFGTGLYIDFSNYGKDENGDFIDGEEPDNGNGGKYPTDGVQLNIFSNTIKNNYFGLSIIGDNITLGDLNKKDFYNDVSENINGVNINGSKSFFTHLRVFDNADTGIITEKGEGNTVETCNLFNNKIGISVTSDVEDGVIQFNRFYNNSDYGLDDSGTDTKTNYNWWGKNGADDVYNGNNKPGNWYAVELSSDDHITDPNSNLKEEIITRPSGKHNLIYSLVLYNGTASIINDLDDDVKKLPLFNAVVKFYSGTRNIDTINKDSRLDHGKNIQLDGNHNPIKINAVLDGENRSLSIKTNDPPTTGGGGGNGKKPPVDDGYNDGDNNNGTEPEKPNPPQPAGILIVLLFPLGIAAFAFKRKFEKEE